MAYGRQQCYCNNGCWLDSLDVATVLGYGDGMIWDKYPRLIITMPPQWGKTSLARLLMKLEPERSWLYVGHSQESARRFASTSPLMRTVTMGLQTPLTGTLYSRIVVDGPNANLQDAVAAAAETKDAILRLQTHLRPTTGKLLVLANRWHKNDVVGLLATEPGWKHINVPAIDDRKGADNMFSTNHAYSMKTLLEIEAKLGVDMFDTMYLGAPQ